MIQTLAAHPSSGPGRSAEPRLEQRAEALAQREHDHEKLVEGGQVHEGLQHQRIDEGLLAARQAVRGLGRACPPTPGPSMECHG